MSTSANSGLVLARLWCGVAEWWVAGAISGSAEDADVELGEVKRLYDERDLWSDLA